MTKALVVGAGITGLATAIVLARQGIEVDLAERQAEVGALGSGITLIGAALRALDRLGLYEECAASGYRITDMENYDRGSSPSAAWSRGSARRSVSRTRFTTPDLRPSSRQTRGTAAA
jgi:2-polyprenyl-6-methoxyphenol hydroxylase-like FAD-dependent oxidoreductase